MSYQMKALACNPARLPGLSERMVVSHYENNYGGAMNRLDAITDELAGIDPATTPMFVLNGLKREELIAANSMILHESYFDSLGASGSIDGTLETALTRDFGRVDRWRDEFVSMGKALGGGSGWVLLSWSPRLGRLTNQWASDHAHTLADGTPLLALDMYEHAYQIDSGAKATAYVDAFMQNVNWTKVATRFATVASGATPLPDGVGRPMQRKVTTDSPAILHCIFRVFRQERRHEMDHA